MVAQTIEVTAYSGLTSPTLTLRRVGGAGTAIGPQSATVWGTSGTVYRAAFTDLAEGDYYATLADTSGEVAISDPIRVLAVDGTYRELPVTSLVQEFTASALAQLTSQGVIFPPADGSEPLSLAEAKAHLRVRHTSEDAYIGSLITMARLLMEADTWRTIVRRQRTLTLNRFPIGREPIYLPRPPLVSIDSINYVNTAGANQALTGFRVDTTHEPGAVVPAYGTDWPEVRDELIGVTIVYTAGYAANQVPEPIKHCLRLSLAEQYESRGPTVAEKRTSLDRILERVRFRDERILPFIRGSIDHAHLVV